MTTASPSGGGVSQQGPNDHSNEFNRVAFLVRQMVANIEKMMPAQVTAANPGAGSPPVAGTVDVQLLVSQIDGNGTVLPNGVVSGVPYFRVQGGKWAVVVDPAVGDFGFIIAADRDISSVKAQPGVAAPGSPRKHSYSDGVFLPCPLSTAVPAATVWLKADGTFVITDANQNVVESTTSGLNFGVGGTTVLSLTSALATFSVDIATPTLTSMDAHTHSGGTLGGGLTGPPESGT